MIPCEHIYFIATDEVSRYELGMVYCTVGNFRRGLIFVLFSNTKVIENFKPMQIISFQV